MTTDAQWNEFMEEHGLACFRADLALSSSQSHSLAEKAEICDQMTESTAAVDASMRADFEALPPDAFERAASPVMVYGMRPNGLRARAGLSGQHPHLADQLARSGGIREELGLHPASTRPT